MEDKIEAELLRSGFGLPDAQELGPWRHMLDYVTHVGQEEHAESAAQAPLSKTSAMQCNFACVLVAPRQMDAVAAVPGA